MAACSLRNSAWHHMRNIALIDRCLRKDGVRQTAGERESIKKRRRRRRRDRQSYKHLAWRSLVAVEDRLLRNQSVTMTKKRKGKMGNINEKKKPDGG